MLTSSWRMPFFWTLAANALVSGSAWVNGGDRAYRSPGLAEGSQSDRAQNWVMSQFWLPTAIFLSPS